MEENTRKVLIAADPNLAAAAALHGEGSSLFVINLCASMAPIASVGKTLPGLETYRLYQVARREDGRTRHRLRLGFFTKEADAESVLNTVRSAYPTAFTACLADEDRKFTRGFLPEATNGPAAAPKPTKPVAVLVETKPAMAPQIARAAIPAAAPITPIKPLTLLNGALPLEPPQVNAAPVNPLAKPTAVAPVTAAAKAVPIAPKIDTSATSEFELFVDDIAAPTSPVVAPAAPAATVAKPAPTEIELSWDAPALDATASHKIVAPVFKTQDVIKAPAIAAQDTKPKTQAVATTKIAEKKPTPPPPQTTPAIAQITQPSKLLAEIELTLENEPTPKAIAAPAPKAATQPFHVGKGVAIPAVSLSLQGEAASTKPPVASPTVAKAAAPAQKIAEPAAKQVLSTAAEMSKMKAAHALVAATAKPGTSSLPDLDSTQTIRALTNDELNDDSQEKWFAIQLAVSDQPVNLDTMPRLDIFEAYRLYSVATAGSGKITHYLRAGFFREEVSAEAVSGYLRTFFASPTVVRISIAEHSRFKDPPATKPAAAAAKQDAKILDLSQARNAKPIPTITMAVESPRSSSATGSFNMNATGTHKAMNSTGAHKALSATSSHKALSATGSHKVANATGTHKALKAASKGAPPATKRSAPMKGKASATGKHKALQSKSLSQQLLDEAREVQLSESAIRKLPKSDSLLSKMFGKRK